MKKLLLALAACAVYLSSAAQCSLIEVPLAQRTSAATLIVEGTVTQTNSFWNSDNTMIYTSNIIEVYKIFKGTLSTTSIEIITEGGTVGLNKIRVEPSLQLSAGQTGVFTCGPVQRAKLIQAHQVSVPQFEVYASLQGFIKYDLATQTASDPFHVYNSIESDVYAAVLSPSLPNYIEVQPFSMGHSTQHINPQNNVASISGFSPTTVTAGTGSSITITGTGFGATQGSGSVRFKNADDGGATFIAPLASQYVSWSSTQIVVEVPSNAGTGVIQVVQGVTQTSAQTLTVSYAHLNVDFDPGPGTIAYQTDHVDDNGSGGYTWRMNTGFAADAPATAAFMRAFDSWRCATGINWTIGANTSINDAVSDGTNIICYDNTAPLSAGILGVCYSYWSGCASGPTIIWYVNELDIIFDDGSNISPLTWQYGPSLPSGSEYDFESVAVHELGHGHQLAHVIAPGAIMHYALSNGASNRTPGVDDLAGANFVQAKSLVANICGPGPMTNHSCGTPPVAAFMGSLTGLCAGNSVSFTDQSTGTPTSWSWTFPGGTPSSSTAQNPTITYNTPGTYDVTLTATNVSGSDQVTINGYITVFDVPTASANLFDVTCNGGSDGEIDFFPSGGDGNYSYSWTPSGQTSQHLLAASAGSHTIQLVDGNGCAFSNTFTLTEPTAINTGILSQADVTCNGGSDGAAQVSVSGGAGGYSFSWAPSGGFTSLASGLTAGTYTCTVTDQVGCTRNQTVTITQPGAFTLSMQSTDETCALNDGTATANPTGGAGPISYSWTPSSQTTQTATNLAPGTYTCVATDVSGCTANNSVTVNATVCSGPQLAPAYCGITLTALNQQLFCNSVPGAQNYRYRVICVPQGFNTVYVRNSTLNNFYMSWLANVQYNRTYTIEVSVRVANVWSAFGPMCTVTTPAAAPLPQLTAPYCNSTLSTLSDQLFCDAVSGATNYRYRVICAPQGFNTVYVRNSNLTNFYMSWLTNVQYGRTYTVEVSAYISNAWTAYGAMCNVTTPAFPTTQVAAPNCGATLAAVSTQFNCVAVPGATNYQWKVENAALGYSSTMTRGSNLTNWALSWNAGTGVNRTYTVTVRAQVGGVWGSYGAACSITTGPVMLTPDMSPDMLRVPAEVSAEAGATLADVSLYPNPATDVVTIESSSEMTKVSIFSPFGELVRVVPVNGTKAEINLADLSSGFYLIQAETLEGVVTKRVIKQ